MSRNSRLESNTGKNKKPLYSESVDGRTRLPGPKSETPGPTRKVDEAGVESVITTGDPTSVKNLLCGFFLLPLALPVPRWTRLVSDPGLIGKGFQSEKNWQRSLLHSMIFTSNSKAFAQ